MQEETRLARHATSQHSTGSLSATSHTHTPRAFGRALRICTLEREQRVAVRRTCGLSSHAPVLPETRNRDAGPPSTPLTLLAGCTTATAPFFRHPNIRPRRPAGISGHLKSVLPWIRVRSRARLPGPPGIGHHHNQIVAGRGTCALQASARVSPSHPSRSIPCPGRASCVAFCSPP